MFRVWGTAGLEEELRDQLKMHIINIHFNPCQNIPRKMCMCIFKPDSAGSLYGVWPPGIVSCSILSDSPEPHWLNHQDMGYQAGSGLGTGWHRCSSSSTLLKENIHIWLYTGTPLKFNDRILLFVSQVCNNFLHQDISKDLVKDFSPVLNEFIIS